MGEMENNLLTTLLLAILFFVLVAGTAAVFLILQWRHRKALSTQTPELDPPAWLYRPAPRPLRLGIKRASCWLAIRQRSPQAVQSALALHNPQPCSWAEGTSATAGQRLFVSPPITGWTLVIGPALPDPCDDADACFRLIMDLSRKLGHIQLFSVNGVLDHHAWVRAEGGRIVRAYAWAGQTLWNQGDRTPAEDDLNLDCREYGETAMIFHEDSEPGSENSDKVHLLAARWSVDPDEIDRHLAARTLGIAGEASRLF